MHDEVSMPNHNAASDGGKSDCVSVTDANSTRPSTVYLSALAIGDEMSCAAVQVESAGLCVKLCPSYSNFLSAVLIAVRRKIHAGTQCNTLSARMISAVRAFGPQGQEAGHRRVATSVRESEGFHLVGGPPRKNNTSSTPFVNSREPC